MADPHGLENRRKALEESFFSRKNAELMDQMRERVANEKAAAELSSTLGLNDPNVVDELVKAGIRADTIAALSLVPLVAVAWADRKMEDQEREAIVKAAADSGVEEGSPTHALLCHWLEEAPEPSLVETWIEYVEALQATLAPAQHRKLGEELIGRARTVANAAGGFLGIGKISDPEEQMLDRLKQPFK